MSSPGASSPLGVHPPCLQHGGYYFLLQTLHFTHDLTFDLTCETIMLERGEEPRQKGGSMNKNTKKFFRNWDKRIAQYNAQREREEAAIAKARGTAKPAPKAQPVTDLDMSELQKRLKF